MLLRLHVCVCSTLNLTWNLNQEGKFLGDPREGHSCVGTHRHARRPRRWAAEAASAHWTELRAPVFAANWGVLMEDDGQYSTLT